jgi:lysyl-tRNA synthetase class 1
MSSSSGKVITLEDLLKVYTPQLVRYLFAGTRPNTEFTISFDLDVIKIYEDYDKTERVAFKAEAVKDESVYRRERRIYELSQITMPQTMPCQVPFRHLCNLIQIAGGDIEKALDALKARDFPGGLDSGSERRLRERCRCAKYWAEECAPEEFRFRLRSAGERAELSEAERAGVRALRDTVVRRIETFAGDKPCAEAIYGAAETTGLDGKALFRAAYQALIGKDQGPRLASFLRSIEKERLLKILEE